METAISNPVNQCSNCGGEIQYDFATNTNKCLYCGSKFKVKNDENAPANVPDDAGCILFKRDKAEFKDKLLKWLVQGDQTPLNLLFSADFSNIEKCYLPVYSFNGTYGGYFNVENKNGKIISENNALNGKFSFFAYGGSDTASQNDWSILAGMGKNIDEKMVVPLQNADISNVQIRESLDNDTAWNNYGVKIAADRVYQKLQAGGVDKGNNYKHYLKYDLKSAGKLYIPYWLLSYNYLESPYNIYMDDATGELIGTKPRDPNIQPPAKGAVFKKYILIGLALWFSILILHAAINAFSGVQIDPENDGYNNLLLSPTTSGFWLIRGAVFLGVFPLLMITVFYHDIVRSFYEKARKIRNNNLDLILTGKRPVKF